MDNLVECIDVHLGSWEFAAQKVINWSHGVWFGVTAIVVCTQVKHMNISDKLEISLKDS